MMAPIKPSTPESVFYIRNWSEFSAGEFANAEFLTGHWVGVTNKNRIAIDVTSG